MLRIIVELLYCDTFTLTFITYVCSNLQKINARNAFSLHLIDTMKDMIRKEKETNFQVQFYMMLLQK